MHRFATLALVAVTLGAAWAGLIDVGDKAPDFALTVGGKASKLSELTRQGPVLIRFAATG